ncbi:unnamed protein product [Pleuronectes platessa]|uniref:Uncharacterized protein n=1 Tax=Pleuronectes platessa TaxID=8262 RepID=A0A9N7YFD2_PLEPL|nr:unnamed protein product [Pleuronectes platessa]
MREPPDTRGPAHSPYARPLPLAPPASCLSTHHHPPPPPPPRCSEDLNTELHCAGLTPSSCIQLHISSSSPSSSSSLQGLLEQLQEKWNKRSRRRRRRRRRGMCAGSLNESEKFTC